MSDVIPVLARFVQLGGACLLIGIFAFLVFVARPASQAARPALRERFEALDRRLLRLATIVLAAALGAGLIDLVRQGFVAAGSGTGWGLVPQTLGLLLTETRYGDIWLVRQALWLLLAALLLLRGPEHDPKDWLALRLGGLVLGGAGLAVGAASGHSASAPGSAAPAVALDALHLLAAGVWAGALVPLAVFLRWARPGGSDSSPAITAGVAIRRFSTLGLLSVAVIVVTGAYAVLLQVGSVPALLGTTYGRWLLVKLALLPPLLGVAFVNRMYLRPRLELARSESVRAGTDAGALVTRLGRCVLLEAVIAFAVLGVVAVLGLTTPARHDPIDWPLPFRFSWETTGNLRNVGMRVAIGGQLAILGLAAVLLALARRRWCRPALIGGFTAMGLGLAVALPPITVDAYPTTYVRPTVPYTAASIVRGQRLYREHCANCHGAWGAGDGPAAVGLRPKPPDLNGSRIAAHTAGDLFWWLTHGVGESAMPGFGTRLSPEARWDVVNFVRTLGAAEQVRSYPALVTSRPAIVAPDLAFTTGVGAERSLRDHRGRTMVLLVFFRLPESLERLSRLARVHFDLREHGCEILAVPLEGADTVYRALGPRPVLFTFVIEGAVDAAGAYGLLGRNVTLEARRPDASIPLHMEFLIDRAGYLRARWLPSGSPDAPGGWSDLAVLFREVERLAREPASVAPDPEHIH
jgi:putative copper export protein/mono/diheme cytochrome c family protein